jgi:selenocysteine-specific elongation factor
MTSLPEKQLLKNLQDLLSKRMVIMADRESRIYIHQNSFNELKKEASVHLDNYHRANPLKAGMPKEELRSKFPAVQGPKLFNLALTQMIKENELVQDENTVRLASHKVSLGVDQTQIRKKILNAYHQSSLTPPYFKELIKTLDIDVDRAKDVLMLLMEEGLIIKAKEDLYFYAQAIETLKKRLVDFLVANKELTTPQFKDMTGVSRKFLIPLIEYFDAQNVTIRVGDIRKLRSR